jgi:hypothetical protein
MTIDAYSVAGAAICVLGLAMLLPSWVQDLRVWLAGDVA